LRCSASTTIVRNFQTLNRCPFLPTRTWRKNTGPPSVSLMATITNRNSGASRISAVTATSLSNTPLTTCLPPASSGWSTCSRGSPATGRIVVRGPATSSSAAATHMSVPVRSRSHASSRSRIPLSSGHASTATVSASRWPTAEVTPPRPPYTGTPAISLSIVPPVRQAPTTSSPW